jgi:hypothetical protein
MPGGHFFFFFYQQSDVEWYFSGAAPSRTNMRFLAAALVSPLALSFGRQVHNEDVVILKPGNSSLSGTVNLKGLGYYYTSFYQDSSCSDASKTFQEGYATGKCLQLHLAPQKSDPLLNLSPSVRLDCSGASGKERETSVIIKKKSNHTPRVCVCVCFFF